jgi:hypothetical protein
LYNILCANYTPVPIEHKTFDLQLSTSYEASILFLPSSTYDRL